MARVLNKEQLNVLMLGMRHPDYMETVSLKTHQEHLDNLLETIDAMQADLDSCHRAIELATKREEAGILQDRRIERMQTALQWYEGEAAALEKNQRNPDAQMASVVVLTNDGGQRAREVLGKVKHG